ncbi:MAG: flagellar biosynthetic protein FliO [Syntrophales bacterium]|jgi:flagellar protein FliO/FliZ|nr:flagellar biosynthetic protein FliO [Syntrophales bacterium]MDY0043113.1 flagellar biosynthetic protein FliO [Syntrophales bacterium]
MDAPDLVFSFLKMVSALLIVAGTAYISLYLCRKVMSRKAGNKSKEDIDILSSRYLGGKNSIILLDVMGHLLVIGLSPAGMTMLAHIGGEESRHRLKYKNAEEKKYAPFSEYLSLLTSNISTLGSSSGKKDMSND